MKKYLPYIITGVVITAVILLVFTGNNSRKHQVDQRVTLRKQDKVPYGTYVAYQTMKYLFPEAVVQSDRSEPGFWDSLSTHEDRQALIIITGQFNADETEMKKLLAFIEKGNDVFVSARTMSWSASDMIGCRINTADNFIDDDKKKTDSLHLFLNKPPYDKKTGYEYPGKALDATFADTDESSTEVLGVDEKGKPNFIRLRAGNGNLFIHLAPLAFSNYFILHHDNMAYFEKLMSVLSPATKRVVWDEYFLNKKFLEKNREKKSWFSVFSQYPGLKAALLTAILTLLLYVLLGMRRKQRYIPVVAKPRNDSLDFVRTIGRLYFDKGDHKNLSRKMSAYFLEHVRNKFKVATNMLDDEFVRNLQYKSGVPESHIREIVTFIQYAEDAGAITDKELSDFHKGLESFYKIT